MPDFPPPPVLELEGDYSSWTEKWVVDCNLGNCMDCPGAGFNVDSDRVLVRGDALGYIFKLSTGELVSTEDMGYGYDAKSADVQYSILQKYAVWLASTTKFHVYKDGALQQAITISGAGAELRGVTISRDGKYIVCWDMENDKLYCYEGS